VARAGLSVRALVAFSRKGPAKAYVQDALDGDAAVVWNILKRENAHCVICGDAKMAQDVEERLLQIFQREGRLTYPGALAMIQAMKREGRFIEDVWGVQLNRDAALPEVVRAKYDRGAGWMARLQRALGGGRPDAGSIDASDAPPETWGRLAPGRPRTKRRCPLTTRRSRTRRPHSLPAHARQRWWPRATCAHGSGSAVKRGHNLGINPLNE
jgi:hypothetical protein